MAQRHTKTGGNPYRVGKVHSIALKGFEVVATQQHWPEQSDQVFAQITNGIPILGFINVEFLR